MFPWDHVAVGYVAASLAARLRRTRLDDAAALAVVLGSVTPDLIDKPLAWTFDVLPTGTTLAHSVFVAVPAATLVWRLTDRWGHGHVGAAFAVGYLLHLPADLVYGPIVFGRSVQWGALLWPVVPKPASASGSLVANTAYYITRFYANLDSPRYLAYLLVELAAMAAAVFTWVVDGTPGVRPVRAFLRWVGS